MTFEPPEVPTEVKPPPEVKLISQTYVSSPSPYQVRDPVPFHSGMLVGFIVGCLFVVLVMFVFEKFRL